jgi:hypothetical protein
MKKVHAEMFITALLIMATVNKQPRYLSVGERTDKLWCIQAKRHSMKRHGGTLIAYD